MDHITEEETARAATARKVTIRTRDPSKRLKAMGLPIELCVRYERLIGLHPGQTPNYVQRINISEAMISAMEKAVRNVQLTADDYRLIADEVEMNRCYGSSAGVHKLESGKLANNHFYKQRVAAGKIPQPKTEKEENSK